MPPFSITEMQVGMLGGKVADYIAEQRAAFLGQAAPIGTEHREALQAFFPVDVLDAVRVTQGNVPEPKFYAQLKAMGIRDLPPFSEMAGITFQDVVVHVEPLTRPLLFHELVHAVQYKHLGLRGFADHYVRGFLTGGSYEEIPLEKQAYELEARFEQNPAAGFSVEEDVTQRIRDKRF